MRVKVSKWIYRFFVLFLLVAFSVTVAWPTMLGLAITLCAFFGTVIAAALVELERVREKAEELESERENDQNN